jgi:hypothetical protein
MATRKRGEGKTKGADPAPANFSGYCIDVGI